VLQYKQNSTIEIKCKENSKFCEKIVKFAPIYKIKLPGTDKNMLSDLISLLSSAEKAGQFFRHRGAID
jgi:hypothetical protein